MSEPANKNRFSIKAPCFLEWYANGTQRLIIMQLIHAELLIEGRYQTPHGFVAAHQDVMTAEQIAAFLEGFNN